MSDQDKAKKGGNPHPATTPAAYRRRQLQEELRLKIQGSQHLSKLRVIVEDLDDVQRELHKFRHVYKQTEVSNARARIEALRVKSDITFRLLAKVLPDLRAIELEAGEGSDLLSMLVNAVRSAHEDAPAPAPSQGPDEGQLH